MPVGDRLSPFTTYVLLFLFVLPFFVSLDDSSVWDSNEAFYVQTPREMLERSGWLEPSFNFQPRLNKPPLSYWIVGTFYKMFGVSLFWERLAMALAAAGSVLALYWIGCLLFSQYLALMAAGILATTFRFLVISRRLFIDVLLLFCVLMAVAFFLKWIRSLRNPDFLAATVFLALGCLTKGPVSLLPVFFLFLFLLFSGRYRELFSAPLLSAGTLFLFITVPWYLLLGFYSGWESVTGFMLKENLGRFTHLDFGPDRGYFYYAGVFLADFFPWSLFFLAGIVWWIRSGRRKAKISDGKALYLLFLWIILWMVVFSLSRNKQEYYILPVYPAAALVVAYYFSRAQSSRWLSTLVAAFTTLIGFLLVFVGLSLFPDVRGLWFPLVLLLPFPFLAYRRWWLPGVLCLTLFFSASFWIYLEPLERYRPIRHFAEVISESELDQRGPYSVGYYRLASPSLVFYLNRPVLELYDVDTAVDQLERDERLYLVVSDTDFDVLQQETKKQLEILDARPRLSTRGSVILEHLASGELTPRSWTTSIYLVTNFPVEPITLRP